MSRAAQFAELARPLDGVATPGTRLLDDLEFFHDAVDPHTQREVVVLIERASARLPALKTDG